MQLTELRIRGVKAVQAGQNPADVAAALGVNRTTVYDRLAMYSKGGWHALRAQLRFMVVEGRVNAATFIEFLKRLMHGSQSPVMLIVDGHPSHKAKMVKEFVASQEGKLELHILPGYSPELNPDELVWNHLKTNALGRIMNTTKEQMKRAAVNHLRKLQKLPDVIRGFFQTPATSYARI